MPPLELQTNNYHGVKVTFKGGAEVDHITLPTDISTLQFTELPSGADFRHILQLLSAFKLPAPVQSVKLIRELRRGCVAIVRFNDPNAAGTLLDRIKSTLRDGEATGELSCSVVPSTTRFGKRAQLNIVTCIW